MILAWMQAAWWLMRTRTRAAPPARARARAPAARARARRRRARARARPRGPRAARWPRAKPPDCLRPR